MRCSNPVVVGKRYCSKHLLSAVAYPKMTQEQKLRYKLKQKQTQENEVRSKLQEFYQTSAWKKLRDDKLITHPWCASCLQRKRSVAAQEVDHVIPVRLRYELRNSLNNLQSLCSSCHSKKTARDRRGIYYDFERERIYS